MDANVVIDGSQGEGGGQMLRTSLSLSLLTGKSFRMTQIRARRKNPGLAAQHLKSIQAAASISNSTVHGDSIGATEILFQPGRVFRDNFVFDIGTAGSTSLVFQTICFPLAWKAPGSTVTIRGGTHVSHSPSFHYLIQQWLPWMKRLGYEFQLEMRHAGFYPRGGGEIFAVCGVHHHAPELKIHERGALLDLHILSTYSNLPRQVGERQFNQAAEELSAGGFSFGGELEELPAHSPGTSLSVSANYEQGSCTYTSLGERGIPAEKFASQAVEKFLNFHASKGAIDEYLSDQLLIPAVLNRNPIGYTTNQVTQHLLTNRDIISQFVKNDIRIGDTGTVEVLKGRQGHS
jgi:RNA 3'-terminal phosphate cyclase (ATP)